MNEQTEIEAGADWTDRELKLIRFAVYRFMNDAYAKARYAAQRGTADQVRAFHADAEDAEAVLAKLRTLHPPTNAEAGREYECAECDAALEKRNQFRYFHPHNGCRLAGSWAIGEIHDVRKGGDETIIRRTKAPSRQQT